MKIIGLLLLIWFLLGASILSPLRAEELVIATMKGSVNSEIAEIVMKEAYNRLGIEIKVEEYPAKRALAESNSGNVDGELTRVANMQNKFKNLVMIPTPINTLEGVVFTKTVDFPVNGWQSLRPYKIGIRRGIRFTDVGTKGMRRHVVNDNDMLFSLLNVGRVDIIVIALANGLQALKEIELSGIKPLYPPVASYPLHTYLHKKHEALIPKLDKVLQEMTEEGFIKDTREQVLKKLR